MGTGMLKIIDLFGKKYSLKEKHFGIGHSLGMQIEKIMAL
jgi:hypothetical protein